MKCYATTCGILLLTLALLGCGGGNGAPAPDNGGGDPNHPAVTVQAPDRIIGDHSVSYVPDQLNILTGARGAELEAIVAKYGCSVLSQNHGWATLQLPGGADLAATAATLEKEYNIAKAEPVQVIHAPRMVYPVDAVKSSSFTPRDPWYGLQMGGLYYNDNGTGDPADDFWERTNFLLGQAEPMNAMGFNSAWDVGFVDAAVAAQPVKIAIIDAGWFDYSAVGRAGFDDTKIDQLNSGYVAADGTFTAGLTAAAWEVPSDGDPTTVEVPYRDTGELMLGVVAAQINDYFPRDLDFDNSGTIESTEVWNEGIAGINPNAELVLIKTGEQSGGVWTFTDGHIASSIDHAVAAGANIVLLGMFGDGAVSGVVSTAIQNARDNNVLVIAPAGDVIDTFDPGSGTFTGTPVDINMSPVTPASDPNVLSVSGTGFNRIGDLPDYDPGTGPIANDGFGWWPVLGGPFAGAFDAIAPYCNLGGDLAAVGFGVGFTYHYYFIFGDGTAGNENRVSPGENYITSLSNFGSPFAAAYVAGAASIVFQALSQANGAPPTDDDVQNELISSSQYSPMAGLEGTSGLLNAGAAAFSGIQGGGLHTIIPAMTVTSAILSQPLAAVTRGTDVSLTVTVADGTAPLKAVIDWGDGPVDVDPWTNGDPVTLVGGYDTLGMKAVNMTITDSNNVEVNVGFALFVINPLGMGITISDVTGATVGGNPVPLDGGTQYRFNANPTNLYTGDIGGVPNDVTFSWDFGDGSPAATGVSPVHGYQNAGSFTLTLTVTETVRPDTQWTVNVSVN